MLVTTKPGLKVATTFAIVLTLATIAGITLFQTNPPNQPQSFDSGTSDRYTLLRGLSYMVLSWAAGLCWAAVANYWWRQRRGKVAPRPNAQSGAL